MSFFPYEGTASIDLSKPTDYQVGCIFRCPDPHDLSKPTIKVEMNVAPDGSFHANQDHLNRAERVAGIAHVECYSVWYEQTYGSPFTMSG